MSLILDALKRSERERRPRRAHDFSSLYESEPEPRRGKGVWWTVLITALALNLTLVGYFLLWPERKTRETPVLPASPASSAPAQPRVHETPHAVDPQESAPWKADMNVDTALPGAPETKALPPQSEKPPLSRQTSAPARPLSQEALVPAGRETRASEPSEKLTRSMAKPGKTGEGGAASRAAEPAFENPKLPGPSPEAPVPAQSAETPTPASIGVKARPDRAAAELPRPDPDRNAAGTPLQQERIPLVKELPASVGEKLKGLRINVHAYYDDPAQCFVFINMRRYLTGDRIGRDGPTLESITPDGVILNYGGGRALLQTDN